MDPTTPHIEHESTPQDSKREKFPKTVKPAEKREKETTSEQAIEQAPPKVDQAEQPQSSAPPQQQPSEPQQPQQKSAERVQIESILSEGLENSYSRMPPNVKLEFRKKGEETASAVAALLVKTRVKVKKVVALIIEWLKMIPGVSKYFLEQEAKIKTDKLLMMKKEKEKDQ